MRVAKNLVAVFAAILATVRLTEILHYEKITLPLREHIGIFYDDEGNIFSYPETFLGELFICFRCLSVWAAGFIILLYATSSKIFELFTYWLSLSWIAIKVNEKK